MVTLFIYIFLVWVHYASDYEDYHKEGKSKKRLFKESIVKVWNIHWILICSAGVIELLCEIFGKQ